MIDPVTAGAGWEFQSHFPKDWGHPTIAAVIVTLVVGLVALRLAIWFVRRDWRRAMRRLDASESAADR